jgi:ApaG protein
MSCLMSVQKTLNPQFDVSVVVKYNVHESRPENNYHVFIYKVKIQNKGGIPAQLISRQWMITDGFGQVEEVRGAGVIGQQPKISAKQSFEYESVCPLTTSSGSMKGFYSMVGDNGESFDVEIPEFFLIAPSALH